jgi:outer membrane receptor for ferrienterochelin and colicin
MNPYKFRLNYVAVLFCSALPLATVAQPTAPAAPTELPPVEVKANKTILPAGKLLLTGEELKQIPGSAGDPMKSVQSFPGITSTDDSSSEPAVRGARPTDNAYYLDFLPIGYLFHLGGFASVIHPDLVRRFDISTAAWGPEYNDVVGGVFDIGLRSPREDRLGAKFDFSLLGASVLVEGPITDNFSFFLTGRRSWFDLLAKTSEDKKEGVTVTVPVFHDTQARLLWSINPYNRLRLDYGTANDKVAFNLSPTSREGLRDPVLIGNSSQKQSYRTAAGVWESDFSKNSNNIVAVGQLINNIDSSVGSAGGFSAKITTNFLRERLQVQVTPSYLLQLGGSVNQSQVAVVLDANAPRCTEFAPNCDLTSAPRLVDKFTTKQNYADLFVFNRLDLSPAWTVSGGLRFLRDDYLKKNFIEPRLGLQWNLSSQSALSLAYGNHNQAAGPEESLRTIGNPALARLRSKQLALGFSHNFDNGWSARAEAYRKTFKGYAIEDPILNYINGASGDAKGFELFIRKEGKGSFAKWSGFASLSLSKSKRKNDFTGASFPFAYDQPVNASLVGQYKLSDAWQFGAKWSFHSGIPYTPIIGTSRFDDGRTSPVYGPINSVRLSPYHKLDLRADWKVSKNFTAYAEIINAYARKNLAGFQYNADYSKKEPVYQFPIFPSIGFQYSY